MFIEAIKLIYPALKENKRYASYVSIGVVLIVALSVGFNKWREFFYNSVQNYEENNIYLGLVIFTILALIAVATYGLTSFYTRYLEFGCRQFLFNKYSKVAQEKHDLGIQNVPQRIQDDTLRLSQTAISLMKAIADASLRLPIFLFILASVAKWWMVLVVLMYAIIGTYLSKRVAQNLINVEYVQEGLEADLRRNLIEATNSKSELPTLQYIIANWYELALRNKILQYYTSFYSQIGVILPFCMLIPLFLQKSIMLGVLFATASAIEHVLTSLSVFVESRDLVVNLQMVTRRLKELE